jgi:ketosteroid isomerase-like protein
MKQQTSQEIQLMVPSTRADRKLKPARRAAVAGLFSLPFATRAMASESETREGDAQLLAVRERVWRDWFAGDRKALLAILPADFIGLGVGGGPGRNRSETIADAEGFASGGGRLEDVRFTDNRIQHLGNVTIIYCGFTFTTQDKAGATNTVTGRATEVFAKAAGRWSHPGWHLDSGR